MTLRGGSEERGRLSGGSEESGRVLERPSIATRRMLPKGSQENEIPGSNQLDPVRILQRLLVS